MEINNLTRFAVFLACTLFLCGCKSTIKDIESNYRRVLYEDGINQSEARAVAQMKLTKLPFTKSFNQDRPRVIKNEYTQNYPNFWFVSFPPRDIMSEVEYLIVVDRYNGGVIRSTEYNPDVQFTFDWLFK